MIIMDMCPYTPVRKAGQTRRTPLKPSCLALQAQRSMKKRRWAAQGGERGFHGDTGHGDYLRLTIAPVVHQSPGEEVQAPGSSKPRTLWNRARRSSRKAQNIRELTWEPGFIQPRISSSCLAGSCS
jgi:hypothetical protein